MRFLIFLFLLMLQGNAVTLSALQSYTQENFTVEYFHDESRAFTLNQIQKKTFSKSSNAFSLGYKKGNVWFKVTLNNQSDFKNFILYLNESFYTQARFFYKEGSLWKEKDNGLKIPIMQREIKVSGIAHTFVQEPKTTQTYYLKLTTKYSFFGKLSFHEKQSFYTYLKEGTYIFFIFYFGAIFILIILNTFLFLWLKEKIYLYYVSYSFFASIFIFKMTEFVYNFHWEKYIYVLQATAAFAAIFLILFSRQILNTQKYTPILDKILQGFVIWYFIVGLALTYSYTPWNQILNTTSLLSFMTLLITSIMVFINGNRRSIYYMMAIALYFMSILLFVGMIEGLTSYNLLTRYGFVGFSLFEMIIFSLLLVNRFHGIQNERIFIQQKLLTVQKCHQDELEAQVEQRTLELKDMVNERELLLKEIYHRVKNNFQIVVGILWLEADKSDELQKKRYIDLIGRIKSMSSIHEFLYASKELCNLNIKEYLEKIIEEIEKLFANKHIQIHSKMDTFSLEINQAMALGIIVNEILHNAIKHNSQECEISLELTQNDSQITLVIQDNGEFILPSKNKGLGLKLIEQFSKKLPQANIGFVHTNGTQFTLSFKP